MFSKALVLGKPCPVFSPEFFEGGHGTRLGLRFLFPECSFFGNLPPLDALARGCSGSLFPNFSYFFALGLRFFSSLCGDVIFFPSDLVFELSVLPYPGSSAGWPLLTCWGRGSCFWGFLLRDPPAHSSSGTYPLCAYQLWRLDSMDAGGVGASRTLGNCRVHSRDGGVGGGTRD